MRGIPPEVRAAAALAARRAGMTLGDWVAQALMEAAHRTVRGQPPAERMEDVLARLADRIGGIEAALAGRRRRWWFWQRR